MAGNAPLDGSLLPAGVRSRLIDDVNGLRMHVLEAGFEEEGRPCVLLLHGFPELAFSWRRGIGPLAAAGYHVVAPDQRGYGRTTGWNSDYDGDLAPFGMLNLVRDAVALVCALGRDRVAAVVGHDFGSPVAAYCALARPDMFGAVALMSAPFDGPPSFPLAPAGSGINAALAALERSRKHYQWYYGTRRADAEMRHCPQGIAAFLRAYFHGKSGDWPGNRPHPLKAWTAEELAKLPDYYVMDLDRGMAQTVAPLMPTAAEIAACRWLTEDELAVYADEYGRTGFQGGLQWYRAMASREQTAALCLYSGAAIEVPACFIAGALDWGVHQKPGALEAMRTRACWHLVRCDLVPGAGHWVQQEKPEAVVASLRAFLHALG